jgi:hypothetical protein
MAEDMEAMLRNSLDAVDRGRRWAILGVVSLFAALAIALAALSAAAAQRGPAASAPGLKAIFAATVTNMVFVACCTAVVVFQITRAVRVILRSIDLSKNNDL